MNPTTTPTPPRRSTAQGPGAFARLKGMFAAKKPAPPLKTAPAGLDTILLPHARSRWVLPAAAGMTPAAIAGILNEALTGKSPRREQELYSLMEATWPRLMKNIQEVKDAVLGLDWNLSDADEEDRLPGARDLVRRARDGMKGDPITDGHGWRMTLSSLMDGWFRGISISQIQWEYRSGGVKNPPAWLPRLTRDLPAWHYGWRTGPMGSSAGGPPENDGRLVLYPDATAQSGQDFPPHKFLIGIRKAGKGHPSGTALLRCLAWWWCAANFSSEWLLNFAQIFGQPFRWATYDSAQDGVAEALTEMMQQMGSAPWGIGPEGTDVKFVEAAKSGTDNPQTHVLTLADTACDLLVLGQTLTTSQGDRGSQALGTVHQSIRADIIDSAAQWLAEILNEQLITSIIALNLGDQGEDASLPWFLPARKDKKDAKLIAETVEIVLRSGVPLLKEEVYEALDFTQPQAADEVFTAPAASGIPADVPPDMRRMLAKLPVDAREYFLARLER